MDLLNIYTDGGCSNNQTTNNVGGWGAVLEFGPHKKELFGGKINTTNNQMELTAVIEAFKVLKKDGMTIRVFSDSSYVCDCFRKKWYESWQKNGWRTSARTDVENQDLWKELISLVNAHQVTFYRVKGHVNLNSKSTNQEALYEKFIGWNGTEFSFEDFKYITEMNNRVDKLANMGIAQLKEQK